MLLEQFSLFKVEKIAAAETGNSGFHQDVPLEEISILDTKIATE